MLQSQDRDSWGEGVALSWKSKAAAGTCTRGVARLRQVLNQKLEHHDLEYTNNLNL